MCYTQKSKFANYINDNLLKEKGENHYLKDWSKKKIQTRYKNKYSFNRERNTYNGE